MQPPARALTVLVVEDHAPLREQIALLLRSAGHLVDEASDGRLALACALQSPPDVLVLDLGLPGLSGLALCRQLRKQAAQPIPVLMLTARDTLPDKLEGFAAGADDYLTKPFASEELLVRVLALSRRAGAGLDFHGRRRQRFGRGPHTQAAAGSGLHLPHRFRPARRPEGADGAEGHAQGRGLQADAVRRHRRQQSSTPPCAAAPTTARRWSNCAATSRALRWPTSACKPTPQGKSCSSSRPPGETAPRTS